MYAWDDNIYLNVNEASVACPGGVTYSVQEYYNSIQYGVLDCLIFRVGYIQDGVLLGAETSPVLIGAQVVPPVGFVELHGDFVVQKAVPVYPWAVVVASYLKTFTLIII